MPEPASFLTRTYGPPKRQLTVAEVKRKLKREEAARGAPTPHDRGQGQLRFLLGLKGI